MYTSPKYSTTGSVLVCCFFCGGFLENPKLSNTINCSSKKKHSIFFPSIFVGGKRGAFQHCLTRSCNLATSWLNLLVPADSGSGTGKPFWDPTKTWAIRVYSWKQHYKVLQGALLGIQYDFYKISKWPTSESLQGHFEEVGIDWVTKMILQHHLISCKSDCGYPLPPPQEIRDDGG